MTNDKIRKAIAPCSLCCGTKLFVKFLDFIGIGFPFIWYIFFIEIDITPPFIAGHNTHGGCCIQGCFILACTKTHDVDFCAECAEFPCGKLTTDIYIQTVMNEWEKGNRRI